MSKLDRFVKFMPKELKPSTNPILNALLSAWAGSDDEIMQQLINTKAQLFVKTAEGTYLDRLASNYGVSRPFSLGLLDEDFQQLIPNLSLKQKQISKSFYDTMDVFWGEQFSRANETTLAQPFTVSTGQTFEVRIDGGAVQSVTVAAGDIKVPNSASATEIARILSRLDGLTVEVIEDPATGVKKLNLRTETPGPRGSIEFVSGFGPLGVTEGYKFRVTDLAQRTVMYQINPGEILIELPAIVPTLRRTLKGSHHFHATSAIEPTVAPATTPWQGSFTYSSDENPFLATSIKTQLSTPILKGSVLNEITVDDSSAFPSSGGKLIFNFGKSNQEYPVSFITVPNSNTILIDPGYSFQNTHLAGSYINLLYPNQATPYSPRKDGSDLSIYLTSPANARDVVQEILASLAAAGIVVSFLVLLPKYTYLIDNPYSI